MLLMYGTVIAVKVNVYVLTEVIYMFITQWSIVYLLGVSHFQVIMYIQ